MITAHAFVSVYPQVQKALNNWMLLWGITDGGMNCSESPAHILETIAENWAEFSSLVPGVSEPLSSVSGGKITTTITGWWICFRVARLHKKQEIYRTIYIGEREVRSYMTHAQEVDDVRK